MEEKPQRNEFEIRMCFDYVNQIRDREQRAKQHNVTILVLFLGAISWALFSSVNLDLPLRLLLVALLILPVVIILYTSLKMSRTDLQCQTLQAMILNGTITNAKEFIEAFDRTVAKERTRINQWIESAVELVDERKT
jgi:hypothetical protein